MGNLKKIKVPPSPRSPRRSERAKTNGGDTGKNPFSSIEDLKLASNIRNAFNTCKFQPQRQNKQPSSELPHLSLNHDPLQYQVPSAPLQIPSAQNLCSPLVVRRNASEIPQHNVSEASSVEQQQRRSELHNNLSLNHDSIQHLAPLDPLQNPPVMNLDMPLGVLQNASEIVQQQHNTSEASRVVQKQHNQCKPSTWANKIINASVKSTTPLTFIPPKISEEGS